MSTSDSIVLSSSSLSRKLSSTYIFSLFFATFYARVKMIFRDD
jgi:hypothetical protein